MSKDNHICGHCKHYDDERAWCRQYKESAPYFQIKTCYEDNQQPHVEVKEPTKTCKVCGRTLPLDQFPRHPRTADGHSTICRECYKTKNADSLRKAAENSAAARKGNKRGPYKPRAIETKPAPVAETKPVPVLGIKPVPDTSIEIQSPSGIRHGLSFWSDRQLFDELIARGYRGKLTRIVELSAPDEQ